MFWSSALLQLGLLVATLFLCLYLWTEKKFKYFQEKGIPFVKPPPILGNTWRTTFGLEQMSSGYARFYHALKGHRFGGVYEFVNPVIVVRDPELIQEVLIKNFPSFHSHGISIDEKTNPLEGHLFNLDGEKWRTMRKKLSPTFTSGKLKWMFGQMAECSKLLIGLLDEKVNAGEEIEIKSLISRFTMDVIGSCAFGYEPEAIKNPDCEFSRMGKKVFTPTMKQMIQLGVRLLFPKFFLSLKMKTVDAEISDFFTSVVSQTFKHRMESGVVRKDFLQLLLELKMKGKVDYDPKDIEEIREEEDYTQDLLEAGETPSLELSDALLTAQAFIFFFAGFETTAGTLSFVLYNLAKNPDFQARCRQEIHEVKDKHGGSFTYDALKEMVFLNACISESNRIRPALDILFRKCVRDSELDGVKIEKGTRIMIPVRSVQMDPKNYPDPEKFKPERFLEPGNIKPCTYMPFGEGPRICIARRFALLEVTLALATILDKYHIAAGSKTKEPLEYDPWGFLNMVKGGIWLKITEANQSKLNGKN